LEDWLTKALSNKSEQHLCIQGGHGMVNNKLQASTKAGARQEASGTTTRSQQAQTVLIIAVMVLCQIG
jgi:hypothetical protein